MRVCVTPPTKGKVKVRITATPKEAELDGVPLDDLRPGTVHEVTSIFGAWLVTQGYAEPEMRRDAKVVGEDEFTNTNVGESSANPRERDD
jgi:hypothetical protein